MPRAGTGTNAYRLTGFDYNLWNPSTNDYTIKQDENNDLLLALDLEKLIGALRRVWYVKLGASHHGLGATSHLKQKKTFRI